jgi:hypothetical protein
VTTALVARGTAGSGWNGGLLHWTSAITAVHPVTGAEHDVAGAAVMSGAGGTARGGVTGRGSLGAGACQWLLRDLPEPRMVLRSTATVATGNLEAGWSDTIAAQVRQLILPRLIRTMPWMRTCSWLTRITSHTLMTGM